MVRIAEQHAVGHVRISQVKTMAGVIRATGVTIIAAIVTMQFLAAVGVNLAPLLASAGVAGVAIGLAAQNIVRDMLNGILILLEDQFNVGDTIKIAGVIRRRRIHDPAQNYPPRRRWHALRYPKLADHHRGQPERRLLRRNRKR